MTKKVAPNDPFLTREPRGKSGLKDLSTEHDEYLYGKRSRRRRGVSASPISNRP